MSMQSAAQSKREKEGARGRRDREIERERETEKESRVALLLARSIHTTQPPNQPPTHTHPLPHGTTPRPLCGAHPPTSPHFERALPNHRTHICTYIYTTYIKWTILITIVLIKRPLLFLQLSFKLIGSISTLRRRDQRAIDTRVTRDYFRKL